MSSKDQSSKANRCARCAHWGAPANAAAAALLKERLRRQWPVVLEETVSWKICAQEPIAFAHEDYRCRSFMKG
jgi:hypothetical protein